eukprot:2503498-Pyramimonas_sp.AAC.1
MGAPRGSWGLPPNARYPARAEARRQLARRPVSALDHLARLAVHEEASALEGMLPRQPGAVAPPRQLRDAADPSHRLRVRAGLCDAVAARARVG